MMRSKSADTIRARVNVYHSTRGQIHECISTFILLDIKIISCNQGRVHTWVSIPFNGHLFTKLKLNNKIVTLTWDTGAIPSSINQPVAQSLKQSPCPKNNPYKGDEKCFRVETNFLTTINNESLPNTWFSVQEMPAYVPFDGLVGSNFYAENLVYFDFDNHQIYVKPALKKSS